MEAKIRSRLVVEIDTTLTELEIRALDALAGYGTNKFIEVFYEHLGKHYLEPNVEGLKSLFEKAGKLQSKLDQIDNIRKELVKTIKE